MQEFTQRGGVRPFGISLLAAGYDDDGPQLYQIDPSGAYYGWRATACGKNFVNAKNFLEKRYSEEMELEDDLFIVLDGSDICPKCGKEGGEYTPTLDECAFC